MMTPELLDDLQEANRLFDEKQLEAAETLVRSVLERNPESALAHQLLGLIHVDRFEIPEGMARLRQALVLRPDLPTAYNSLGHCHVLLGDDDQALAHFNTALWLEPQHVLAHYNRAVVWLKLGRFRQGWVEHEWRFVAGVAKRQQVAQPMWDGSSLEQRSLLIYTEQGLGDVLQFARFLPILRRRARRLVVACHHPLRPFLESLRCIDDWFPIDQPHEINFDVYAALMSVPALLNISEQTIPRSVPYLFAEPARIETWRRPIRGLPGFKVGICWQGNPLFRVDRYRSIPLRHFAPMATIPGVTLVCLQHGAGLEQVESNRTEVPVTQLTDLDRDGVFLDRAAVMRHLDLIITSDTSIAHLAGGLGRPVWLALATNCDWRWLRDRSDSPWYPTMRLFRQRTPGDWTTVFAEIAEALRANLAARLSEIHTVRVPMSAGELLDRLVVRSHSAASAPSEQAARELDQLWQLRRDLLPASAELDELAAALERLDDERIRIEEQQAESEEKDSKTSAPATDLVDSLHALHRCRAERAVLIDQINTIVGREAFA